MSSSFAGCHIGMTGKLTGSVSFSWCLRPFGRRTPSNADDSDTPGNMRHATFGRSGVTIQHQSTYACVGYGPVGWRSLDR